jgi:acyl-CoA thioesterase-1
LLGLGAAGIMALGAAALGVTLQPHKESGSQEMVTLYTFGDAILDCGHYNQYSLHPGGLIVRNDDRLFPEFRGQDLMSGNPGSKLEHRAQDGGTVEGLPAQARGLKVGTEGRAIAIVTVGGNDLLRGLVVDSGPGIERFKMALDAFLKELPIRPVLLGNVYDPSFGDDTRNFLGVDPKLARANHQRINSAIAELASRYGQLVDLHGHFLKGDPSWYTQTIEPSLVGASEVRRAFLSYVLQAT